MTDNTRNETGSSDPEAIPDAKDDTEPIEVIVKKEKPIEEKFYEEHDEELRITDADINEEVH